MTKFDPRTLTNNPKLLQSGTSLAALEAVGCIDEDAVRMQLFHRTVEDIKARNAGTDLRRSIIDGCVDPHIAVDLLTFARYFAIQGICSWH